MPGRKVQPPRLMQRRDGAWIIRDRGRDKRTGCTGSGADVIARAAEKLGEYIGSKHRPSVDERNPDKLPIADVLLAYDEAKAHLAKHGVRIFKEEDRRDGTFQGRSAYFHDPFRNVIEIMDLQKMGA